MKKSKLLTPILGLSALAGVVAPAVALAGCSNNGTNVQVSEEVTKLGVKVKSSNIQKGKDSTITFEIPEGKQLTKVIVSIPDTNGDVELSGSAISGTTVTIPAAKMTSDKVTVKSVTLIDPKAEIASIAIKQDSQHKKEYYKGEKLDFTNLAIEATMVDGSTKRDVTLDECTFSPEAQTVLSTEGTQKVTVTLKSNTAITTSFDVTVHPAVVKSMIVTPDAEHKYFVGNPIEYGNLKVEGELTDGTKQDLVYGTDYATDPAISTTEKWTEADKGQTKTITVSYIKQDVPAVQAQTFNITIVEDEVESIAIAQQPTTIVYYSGQKLNLAGLQVKARFKNGYERLLNANEYTTDPVEGTTLTTDVETTKTVTITYANAVEPQTITLTLHPAITTGLKVSTLPTKTTYADGETLDLTGMIVKEVRTDGEFPIDSSKYTVDPAEGTVLQKSQSPKKITVSLNETSFKDDFNVTIGDAKVKSIAITTQPTKTAYNHGDYLDLDDLVVTATLSNGQTRPLESTEYTTDPSTTKKLENDGGQTGEIKPIEVQVAYKNVPTIVAPTKIDITVTPKPYSFTLNATSQQVVAGNTFQLSVASINPATACKDVTWVSSAPTIADVDENGLVTVTSETTGLPKSAIITATSKINTSLSQQCTITVVDDITSVSIEGDHNIDILNIDRSSESKHTFKAKDQAGRELSDTETNNWKVYEGEQTTTESSNFEIVKTAGTSVASLQLKDGKTAPTMSTTLTIQVSANDKSSTEITSEAFVVEVANYSYFKTEGDYGMKNKKISTIDVLELSDNANIVVPKIYYDGNTAVEQTGIYSIKNIASTNNLGTLYIPKSIKNINTSQVLVDTKIMDIVVDPTNLTYSSQDLSGNELHCVVNKSSRSGLVLGCKNTTTIPSSITTIWDDAFAGIPFDDDVTLDLSHITSIGSSAFYGSTIGGVTLGSSITEIPYQCFRDCSKLKSINIPKNIKTIGIWAFYNATGLTAADATGITFEAEGTNYGQWEGNKEQIHLDYVWDVSEDPKINASFLVTGVDGEDKYLKLDLKKKEQTDKTQKTYTFTDFTGEIGGVTLDTAFSTVILDEKLIIPTEYVNGNVASNITTIAGRAFYMIRGAGSSYIKEINFNYAKHLKYFLIHTDGNIQFKDNPQLNVMDFSNWTLAEVQALGGSFAGDKDSFYGCCVSTGLTGTIKVKTGTKEYWKTIFNKFTPTSGSTTGYLKIVDSNPTAGANEWVIVEQ